METATKRMRDLLATLAVAALVGLATLMVEDQPSSTVLASSKTYLSAMGTLPKTSTLSADPPSLDKAVEATKGLDADIEQAGHMGHVRLSSDRGGPSIDDLLAKEEKEAEEVEAAAIRNAAQRARPDKTLHAKLRGGDAKALNEGLDKAAHWETKADFSTRLPRDRPSPPIHEAAAAPSPAKGGNGWAQPGGWQPANRAFPLRVKSFWGALSDCRAKGDCKELLGAKLWKVLQTRKGTPNMRIYHEQDPERKREERSMEKDFLNAKPVNDDSSTQERMGDTSRQAWNTLQSMMRHDRPGSAKPQPAMTQGERKEDERLKAKEMGRVYARESDMIFSDDSTSANNHHYQASMVPTKGDERAEATSVLRDEAKSSAEDRMVKLERKAIKGLEKEGGGSVQGVLTKMNKAAAELRGGDGKRADAALEAGIRAHEREDAREDAKVESEADEELHGFDRPFGGSGGGGTRPPGGAAGGTPSTGGRRTPPSPWRARGPWGWGLGGWLPRRSAGSQGLGVGA